MDNIPHGTENGYGNYHCRCDLCRAAKSERGKREREEKRARPISEIPHGTVNGYQNFACRCEPCRQAMSRRKKELKQRALLDPDRIKHGSRSSYQGYGCRCEACTAANREYDQRRRAKNPDLKEQARERERRWRARHPEQSKESAQRSYEKRKQSNWERMKAEQKERNDAYRLRSKGVDVETEAELLASQNGVCAICGQTDKTKLSIDHCHETGRIRGLLCRPCNLGLGCFKDDVERLKKAIEYLVDGLTL